MDAAVPRVPTFPRLPGISRQKWSQHNTISQGVSRLPKRLGNETSRGVSDRPGAGAFPISQSTTYSGENVGKCATPTRRGESRRDAGRGKRKGSGAGTGPADWGPIVANASRQRRLPFRSKSGSGFEPLAPILDRVLADLAARGDAERAGRR